MIYTRVRYSELSNTDVALSIEMKGKYIEVICQLKDIEDRETVFDRFINPLLLALKQAIGE